MLGTSILDQLEDQSLKLSSKKVINNSKSLFSTHAFIDWLSTNQSVTFWPYAHQFHLHSLYRVSAVKRLFINIYTAMFINQLMSLSISMMRTLYLHLQYYLLTLWFVEQNY